MPHQRATLVTKADIIVDCTSVGMYPQVDVPAGSIALNGCMTRAAGRLI